jgi:hypothetical protein
MNTKKKTMTLILAVCAISIVSFQHAKAQTGTYSAVVNLTYWVVGGTTIAAACTGSGGGACAIAVAAVLVSDEAAARFSQNGCEFIIKKFNLGTQVRCEVKILGPKDLVMKYTEELKNEIKAAQ